MSAQKANQESEKQEFLEGTAEGSMRGHWFIFKANQLFSLYIVSNLIGCALHGLKRIFLVETISDIDYTWKVATLICDAEPQVPKNSNNPLGIYATGVSFVAYQFLMVPLNGWH